MNDDEIRAHQEVASRNAQTAIKVAESTKSDLSTKISHLGHLMAAQEQRIADLERKYVLLLTARFDGRATSGN